MPKPTPFISAPSDAEEAQRFAIFDVLTGHCGEMLSPNKVDVIMAEILHEMREGPCAWSFAKKKTKRRRYPKHCGAKNTKKGTPTDE